tara:strand:+ start:8042 stop:8728 length:687 start_codon:yes stop_codon:yes gene_type:complete
MATSHKTKHKNPLRYFLNAGLAFMSLSVGGCMGVDLYEPPTINESRIQVEEETFFQDVAVDDVDDAYLGMLARHYTKHGGSPMDLIITYDPRSYRNTAMKATDMAASIAGSLRGYGVSKVNAGVMPIKSQGDEARLLVTYDSYNARPPEGCDNNMPGMNKSPLEHDERYKLGCSIDTLVARQVSKPSDLLGRGKTETKSDGRPISNIIDLYRVGTPNTSLDGEKASDE